MRTQPYPGADESTPSLAQYFSWINHTNEGPTEAQTLANLEFFQQPQKNHEAVRRCWVSADLRTWTAGQGICRI